MNRFVHDVLSLLLPMKLTSIMRTGLAAGVKICMIGTINCETDVGEIVD